MNRIPKAMVPDVRDAHTYLGILLMAVGAGLLAPAAGLIVAGGSLAYIGIFRGSAR